MGWHHSPGYPWLGLVLQDTAVLAHRGTSNVESATFSVFRPEGQSPRLLEVYLLQSKWYCSDNGLPETRLCVVLRVVTPIQTIQTLRMAWRTRCGTRETASLEAWTCLCRELSW